MFAITFETSGHSQWLHSFVFSTYEGAKTELLNKGFKEKGGIFYKDSEWVTKNKAYITPVTLKEV